MEPHRSTGRWQLGLPLAATTMLLWGLLPLALKLALRELDAATITWFRFLVSALVLGALLATRRRLPGLGALGRSGWLLLAVATLFLAANYLAYLVGLDLTTAGHAQVLIQLAPLLLALGALLVFRERFDRLQWLGFAVLLGGLALFFGDQLRALAAGADRFLLGSGMLVVAALTWAVYGLAQKQLLQLLPSQAIMLCIYLGCAALFTPLAEPRALARLDGVEAGALLFCALNTAAAYGAFSEALAHWEASRVSSVLALTPLATLGFAWLAAGLAPALVEPEPRSPAALLGAGLVVLGSLLTALGGARAEPQAARLLASGDGSLAP